VGLELTLSEIAVQHASSIELSQQRRFCSTLSDSYVDTFENALAEALRNTPSSEAAVYVFSSSRWGLTSVLVQKLTRRTETIFDQVIAGQKSASDAEREFQSFVQTAQQTICR
jgi:hypothetical protein